MEVEPYNSREKQVLHRIEMSQHISMRIAAPGLLVAAVTFGVLAYSSYRRGQMDFLYIFLAGIFLGQACMVFVLVKERQTTHKIFNRLTEKQEKNS